MGLFDFWRSPEVESPWADTSNLEQITLAELYGLTSDKLPVNRATAMGVPSLSKGRNLICGSVARLPLMAFKDGSPAPTQPAFLQQLQHNVPNIVTIAWAIDAMIFHGRAWLIIENRLTNGTPQSLRWIPEADAQVENGVLVKAFNKPVKRGDAIRIDAIHEGILAYGKGALREATQLEALAAEVGGNPTPHTVLKQREGADMSKPQIDALLSSWRTARKTPGGSVAFVNKAVDVETFGQHVENLLIDGRNQSALQMARLLGLPAWAVDANVKGASMSYSNRASRNSELLDALNPYIESFEQTLSMWLPYGTKAKFDTSELLADDRKTQIESAVQAVGAGIFTKDEVRASFGLEPLPEVEEPTPPREEPTNDQEA